MVTLGAKGQGTWPKPGRRQQGRPATGPSVPAKVLGSTKPPQSRSDGRHPGPATQQEPPGLLPGEGRDREVVGDRLGVPRVALQG